MSRKWLEELDPERREAAGRLIRLMEGLEASDAARRARAEVAENHPLFARFLLLRHLWTETIDPWRDHLDWVENLVRDAAADPGGPFADAGRALARLLEAGADPRDIGRLARFVAYEAVFSVVHTLDEGYDPEHEGQLPGWALVERDALGHLTGRLLKGLHADLPGLDPSGREGRADPA